MRVVLREGANAHESVQRSGRLEAVHLPELGNLHRKFAIAAQTVLENLHMAGAVHRLTRTDAFVFLALLRRKIMSE